MENYNEIEIDGKIINLSKLSDEELKQIEEYLIEERKMLRQKVDEYLGIKPEDFNQ